MTAAALTFKRIDKATIIAFGCIIAILIAGALYDRNFLSADYLLQQLLTASFLGVIATVMKLIILLGHIDLSIPWTISIGGMMATGAAGFLGHPLGDTLAIPFGILCGTLIGVVNG